MDFNNIIIVLVEPQGALNIGSVCRAMMNFGFSKLRIVNPFADHLCEESRNMALKASTILEHAEIFNNLLDALKDRNFVIGTTRRHGKYRKNFLIPSNAAKFILSHDKDTDIALIFGREDFGLSTQDLHLCHKFITIPTHDNFASMNLAHAVTLCLYELRQNKLKSFNRNSKKLATIKNTESMFFHMKKTLLSIDFLDPQNPDHVLRTFRNIFNEKGLNDRDVSILHGLWSRIDWLKNEINKYKEKKNE